MLSHTRFSYALLAMVLAGHAGALPQPTSSPASTLYSADPPSTNLSIPVKSLGTLSLSSAAFAAVVPQDGEKTLFVSSFQPFGSDSVSRINGISKAVASGVGSMKATKVPGSITWPNDITAAPKELFGTDGIVVGGGFLVPGKSNGGLYFSASSNGVSSNWVQLISKSGWFYHRAIFADIDNDGKLEIVSCRANKPIIGGASTMLVYLKPRDASKPAGAWVETELGPGCDALFTVADFNGDGRPEVLAASFFTSQLNLYLSQASTGFANPKDVKKVTLDTTIGAAFDVEFTDVNGDGKKDLLVSNHQGSGASPTGSVYAYEIPSDMTAVSSYVRHTLASGFPVTQGGFNQASPGSPIAFHPTPVKSGPAYIALAGDAAQIAYVLVPGRTPWSYTTTTLHNCGCTVGGLAVADVDGDGYEEIFIPCYDDGILAAYTFAA